MVGPRSRPTITNWATHTLREHNREADMRAARGAKGEDEWVDTVHVAWSEVTGLCGFWDDSCDNGKCGAGIVIQAFTESLGWVSTYKKCGPVTGRSSLDAELGGCGMLLENLRRWINKKRALTTRHCSLAVDMSPLCKIAFFRWHALHAGWTVTEPSTPPLCWWHAARVCGQQRIGNLWQ